MYGAPRRVSRRAGPGRLPSISLGRGSKRSVADAARRWAELGGAMSGIGVVAAGIEAELRRRLPRRRKTRRGEPALSVATTLGERSADLTDPAAALPRPGAPSGVRSAAVRAPAAARPRPAERVDVRCQRVARLLADPRVDCDALMRPFAGEATRRTGAAGGTGVL